MTQSNPTENLQAPPKPVRNWQARGRLLGMPIAIVSIWAALFVAASAVPALPVPGMTGMITMNTIMTAISGAVLGPAAGVANMVGAIISTILFPFGSFFGLWGALTVTMGGLISGLLFANKWKLAGLLEVALLVAWFVNPRAWQPWMWIVPLPYSLVTLLVIFVSPLRRWMRKQILTGSKAGLWAGVALIATVGHSAEFMTSNVMTNYMYNLTWQYWVPTWPYWVGVDTVTIVMATVVGVGILSGLRKARLIQAADIVPAA
ncbi:MAG: hypothetical protein EHM41_01635 [Chloroflexi bacterium]|nr:MAG: hypothetical protein EHM41_01635 [Chloroflexota bacterium]